MTIILVIMVTIHDNYLSVSKSNSKFTDARKNPMVVWNLLIGLPKDLLPRHCYSLLYNIKDMYKQLENLK